MYACPCVRRLAPPEIADAIALVRRVFREYVAPEYNPAGVAEFERYVDPANLRKMLTDGTLLLWGCFLPETPAIPVGVLALRPPNHLSLLFVDGAHHRQGIARVLFAAMLPYCREQQAVTGITEILVHSSPYAVQAYTRLGFSPTGPAQTENGICFIPMSYPLPKAP